MRRLVQVLVSLLLTILVGYLIYREVPDWGQALRVMVEGRPLLLVGGLVFVALHMLLRATRWGVLLKPAKHGISFRNLFSLTLVKYVVNVIPPRAGEVAASAVLAKKEEIPAATVIAASVLERILDSVTVISMFVFYLVFFSHLHAPDTDRGREIMLSVRSYSIKGLIVLSAGFAIVALLLRRTHWSEHIPRGLRRIFLHSLEGFRALQSRAAVFQVMVLSVAIWVSITFQLWCLVGAYLDNFPFTGTLLLMAMTVVGVSIPTPGGVGGFQYFMSITLVNFFAGYLSSQDPYSQVAGISNGAYLISMGPVIIIGLIFLNKEGISLGRIGPQAGSSK